MRKTENDIKGRICGNKKCVGSKKKAFLQETNQKPWIRSVLGHATATLEDSKTPAGHGGAEDSQVLVAEVLTAQAVGYSSCQYSSFR
jgi:hypothetical protein